MKKTISENWIYAVLVVAAVALVYGQFLSNPLVFDDIRFFGGLEHLAAFSPLQIRWLPYATIAWTVGVLGEGMFWLRLEALVLHSATGVALFFFIQRLHQQVEVRDPDGDRGLPAGGLACAAALLFVLHPAAVYGAAYLVQRTIVMATLFCLLALLAYLHGLKEKRAIWLWLSVALYLLAVLSKEHAIMLPAVMLAMTVLLGGTFKTEFSRLWKIYLACLGIAIFVVFQKYAILGTVYEKLAPEMLQEIKVEHAYPLSILTQCWLFFKYLGLWLFPNTAWFSVDMREPFADSLMSPYWFAVLGFVGYGVLAVKLLLKRGKTGLLGFALLFPWLLFFTEFSAVRIQEPFALYRSYLWMAGICIAAPVLFGRLEARKAAWLAGVLALVLAALAVGRLTTFSQRFLLWNDAAILMQDKQHLHAADRIYANRGKSLRELGRYREAIADYQVAISLRPNYANYHHGIAIAYLDAGDYARAIDEFGKAIGLEPQHVRAYYGRGEGYLLLGNLQAAREDFAASCQLGWQSGCKKLGGLPQ